MVRQNNRFYDRWLPGLIVAMVLVSILAGVLALYYVEASLVASGGESLTLTAVDIADKLDLLMDERYADIQMLSRSLLFQGGDSAAMGERLFALLDTYPVYRWAGVTDANGLVLAATDGISKNLDLSGDPGFVAVKAGQRTVVQDALPHGAGGSAVTFVSPRHDANGAFIGAVITQVGLPVLEDAFARSVNALQTQWGTGARIEYQFLDHDGNVFVDSFLREEGRVNLKRQGLPSAQLFDMAPAGFIEERHGRREIDVVTGYAQTKGREDLTGLGWGVLVRVDRSDILVPIRAVLWKVGAAGLGLFLPLMVSLFWSISGLSRSLRLTDQEGRRARAAESRFQMLLEHAPAAIVMANVEGTIVLTNRQVDLLFGYAPGQLIGQSVEVLIPESVRNVHRTHRARFHESPQARSMGGNGLIAGRRQDGTEFQIQAGLSQMQTEEGLFAVAILRDISQEVREEAERERLAREVRLLLDSAVGGLCGIDRQGCCTFINRSGALMLGYQPEEMLGKDLHTLIHHSHEDGSSYNHDACPIYRAAQASQSFHIDEDLFWRRDGTSFSVEIDSCPVFEGEVMKGGVVTFADVSERKGAAALLQKREAILTAAQELAHLGSWEWDIQTGTEQWSAEQYRIFGYAPNSIKATYELFKQALHIEDREKVLATVEAALNEGAPYEVECRIVHLSGEVRSVQCRGEVFRDATGTPVQMHGTVLDITDRRQAEAEVKIRANWQEAVLDYAGFAIIATTPDGLIQTFNRAAQRMLGYGAEEVIGKMTPAVIHDPQEVMDRATTFSMELGERIEPGFEVFVAKTRRGLPNEHEWIYIKKDGTRFPVLLSVTALKGSTGGIAGFLGLALDITERKQSEAALKAYAQQLELINQSLDVARNQAEAATEAKSNFLASMSHEIRTPMNGVIGMTGLLLDTDLTTEQRELAEIVRSSGDHLLTVINDILDFSKIEAGKMNLEIIDFDLRTAVDESMDLLAECAASKGLNLACLFHAEVPEALRGDPGRLRQILLNLLGNAIKFTEQGDVVLSITLLHHTDTDATVRFEVQDTGIGLSLDAQGHLFQSFSQADNSTTRKFGGTGLGLAICKQITELMGGHIGVESRPGEGSTFWFTVQFGKQPEATASARAMAPQDLHGLQLCIVDHSSINRRILELYTERWGARCLLAEDGRQALTLMRKAAAGGQACVLAIIDMLLPGMNGLELAGAIKADPVLAPTRLVLLTSQGQRGDAQAAQAAGYAGYLSKPVHAPQLYECLLTVLKPSAPAPAREGHSAGLTARPGLVTRHTLAEGKAQASAKILVAEDNVVNQKVAVRMLEKLGYRVDLAANGLEVLEALSRIPYAAVLMDCHMPEMDGFNATAEIRKREASGCVSSSTFQVSGSKREDSDRQSETCNLKLKTRGRIPIIAMTANARQEDRDLCLAAGMDDYVSKPVQPKVLAEVLARWVSAPASISNFTDNRLLRNASGGTAA